MTSTDQKVRAIYIANRNDRMRRARNAMFYAGSTEISERARARWLESVRQMVGEARANNQAAVRVATGYSAGPGIWFGGAGF